MRLPSWRLPLEIVTLVALLGVLVYPAFSSNSTETAPMKPSDLNEPDLPNLEIATLGGGCFWCIEAVYEPIEGVESVVSGYAGGHVKNPTYHQVSSGETGHAEVTQISYDPSVISYEEILDLFWQAHDPTTLNRQGNDVGPQYRSIILYHNDQQKQVAEQSLKKAQEQFDQPIVTEIQPMTDFYPAEDYHQDFYENNPNHPYSVFVIKPKLEKLKKKEEAKH
ncbi:MAG: peptide-methionine (S)-S-oxide reductase [Puniceicoccaceae bacterium 5H]|nr:MAG: peptide-methionine (S)-S-oxide reductase [Puniceicoccaceae bacterium 5H]